MNPTLTIAIPVYPMKGAVDFLKRCLDSIKQQSFTDYEIVITDNSEDSVLEKFVTPYDVVYSKNPVKGMAANTNEAIRRSKGRLIKVLYMDDYLAHKHALKEIVDGFTFSAHWLITPVNDNQRPYYTKDIHLGNNKLGSPSALTILNEDVMYFDEKLPWMLDCDYYKRMYEKWGQPIILTNVGVIMGVGDHQVTQLLTNEDKTLDVLYLRDKYE